MALRDHEPIILENFNGLWQKGDIYRVPQDHFTDCENIRFVGSGSFASRYGLGLSQNVATPLTQIVRVYNYVTQDKNTLLVLNYDGTNGKIYHVVDSTTVFGPLLTIAGMKDFGFAPYAGRAYITPFSSFTTGGITIEKGLQNQFLYVYKGDGTAARKVAGTAPVGTLTVGNGAVGFTDPGFKVFAVIYETDTGYLTAPAAFATFTTGALLSVNFSTIPIGGATVVKRHIVATKTIIGYNGNTTGYTFYYLPNGTINDNVAVALNNISFYDADLLEEASHLLDNYAEIPAGVGLCFYHDRLCIYTTFTDISTIKVSSPGEPEAFSSIDGILVVPPDGNPITNAQEFRDILYVMKKSKTVSYVDNDDYPSTWTTPTVVDQGLGTSVHGIATVADSGAASINHLIVATMKGIMIFNGIYVLPELSWKISKFWLDLDKNNYRLIQLLNDTVNQILYCGLPNYKLLIGDYANGLDPKEIRWAPWKFDIKVSTIGLTESTKLIIGSEGRL